MTIENRDDLFYEVEASLDGSGSWTGDWIESSDILSFVVARQMVGGGPPELSMEGSEDAINSMGGPQLIASNDTSMSDVVIVPYRYFRFSMSGGLASATIRVTARTYQRSE